MEKYNDDDDDEINKMVVVVCSLWTVCQELFLHILYDFHNNQEYYFYNAYKVVAHPCEVKITNR